MTENADHTTHAGRAALPLSAADRERILGTYALPSASVNAAMWDALIARAAKDHAPITVFEIDQMRDGARSHHDAYLAAIVAATEQADGALLAATAILEPVADDN